MQTKINQRDSNGLKHGYWKYYKGTKDINLKLTRTIWYNHGAFHGEYVTYFDDGTVFVKGSYKDGFRHGYWEQYWNSGNLRFRGCYEDGNEIGLWEFYDSYGALSYIEFYAD